MVIYVTFSFPTIIPTVDSGPQRPHMFCPYKVRVNLPCKCPWRIVCFILFRIHTLSWPKLWSVEVGYWLSCNGEYTGFTVPFCELTNNFSRSLWNASLGTYFTVSLVMRESTNRKPKCGLMRREKWILAGPLGIASQLHVTSPHYINSLQIATMVTLSLQLMFCHSTNKCRRKPLCSI